MAITQKVPKDLSGIKTKVALNLTRRQIVCFGGAGIVGFPLYLSLKDMTGTDIAAICMAVSMLPFFFLAMYEKDGLPAERYLYLMFRQRYLSPGIRRYVRENVLQQLEEREKICREVARLEGKKARKQDIYDAAGKTGADDAAAKMHGPDVDRAYAPARAQTDALREGFGKHQGADRTKDHRF